MVDFSANIGGISHYTKIILNFEALVEKLIGRAERICAFLTSAGRGTVGIYLNIYHLFCRAFLSAPLHIVG